MSNHVLDGIMGLCVADALGVPVEFVSRSQLRADPVTGMRAYGTYHQPAGTWSDDTSMTLCLLDSLAEAGRPDYEDIMQKFRRWHDQGDYTPYGEVFDVGSATRRAINRCQTGTPALQCGGRAEGDNGNGSLMRILPLLYWLQARGSGEFDAEAFDIIHNVSALTHAHPRSQMACGIYLCIAAAITTGAGLSEAIHSGIKKARQYYDQRTEFAAQRQHYARLEDSRFAVLPEDKIKSSGYVVDTLEAALWCLLNTDNYRDCVLKAVNLGEDTDTVAAVAGGLAGLYYGYEAIPAEWLTTIARRDYIESLCASWGRLNRPQLASTLSCFPGTHHTWSNNQQRHPG